MSFLMNRKLYKKECQAEEAMQREFWWYEHIPFPKKSQKPPTIHQALWYIWLSHATMLISSTPTDEHRSCITALSPYRSCQSNICTYRSAMVGAAAPIPLCHHQMCHATTGRGVARSPLRCLSGPLHHTATQGSPKTLPSPLDERGATWHVYWEARWKSECWKVWHKLSIALKKVLIQTVDPALLPCPCLSQQILTPI